MKEKQKAFDHNWNNREESLYNHWTRGDVQNQVQLAFRNHWETISDFMQNNHFNGGERCLEVGCGRGSLSAYFCEAGFKCTLLDLSPTVVDIARQIFRANGHNANFIIGDVHDLPFPESSFDVCVSIGLMEHVEDIKRVIGEQVRVLDSGGIFIAYVVPERSVPIQAKHDWINVILKEYHAMICSEEQLPPKEKVFRTTYGAEVYLKEMRLAGLLDAQSSGAYPLPMISHSTNFPFSLMPPQSEKVFVKYCSKILQERAKSQREHPWLCEENYGQAFFVWGFKE